MHHLKALIAAATLLLPIAYADDLEYEYYDCEEAEVGRAVLTSSGLVEGHAAPNEPDVSEYLGIPFAQPPVGDLRFAPPVRYYSDSALSGLSTNKICPQADLASSAASSAAAYPAFLGSLAGLGQERNEDCLTLNVWTKYQEGDDLKPVMVWIYGGGFATGSSNASAYSGQHWVQDEDVVFVNFNYRLGIFGFSGGPTLTQNVGLLDQRMAVEWVRDNIEAFGGDASRITLFGESAGAASTDYYNYAWADDPIIAGSIFESGQANAFGNKDGSVQADRWYAVTTSVGCGNLSTSTADEVVACMRDPVRVPSLNLTTASIGSGAFSLILSAFGPTIDNKTVFSNYTDRNINGQLAKRPVLTGSNDFEAGIFIFIFGLFGTNLGPQAADVLTSTVFTCPSNSAAYARYLNNIPAWRYRFFPSFPNIQINTSIGRAYHLSEVFPLFGTDVDASGQKSTPIEKQLGDYMRKAWATFARDPVRGLSDSEFAWPEYSPDVNATALIALGKDNSTGAMYVPRGDYDGSCPLFYQGIAATK